MVVELITVGTELLLGNIVNTNAFFLSEQCAKLGYSLYYHITVGDNGERLEQAIRVGLDRSDVIILTGGLGPTDDDITKEVAARVMEKSLALDEHSKRRMEEFLISRYQGKIPANNDKQAYIPEGSIIMDNENGTAPGIIMEKDGKSIILLPGPPNELVPMFKRSAVPYLTEKADGVIHSVTVKICGIGESAVEMQIKDLLRKQGNPTLATYAKTGEVHIRLTAKAATVEAAESVITPVLQEVRSRFSKNIFTEQEQISLEEAVIGLLKDKNLTMATAESCTGGLLAGRLINVAGISQVFMEGYITYSNKAKRKLLGVKKETLHKYGAVSEKTAKEMAKGGAKASKSDVCISVTGIAGPDGGTPQKPVGLVYIGCYVAGNISVRECHWKGSRGVIRERTVAEALTLLWQYLQ